MTPPAAAAAPAVRPRRGGEEPGATPKRAVRRPRPLTAPHRPRRVSGPTRRARPEELPARRRARDPGVALRLIPALESLAQHRLLDRLIRGRGWIALVAFALIGIVTLQLGLLKLNGGIGRALEREALLQRQNAALSIENSEMAAGDRVVSLAAGKGMAFVSPRALRFLWTRPRIDLTRGAAALSSPARSSTEGATEASNGASSTAAAPSTESSNTESSTAQSATTPGSAEPPSGTSEESKTASAESTASEATAPSGSAAPSATAPPEGGSPEVAPVGGTQARVPRG